ncbi:LysR substrate-binding domain-containing protein [Mesorhizobium sp. M0814]|uniref:LysR substrate-binding domain-containing protein n=1 Tax=Mesorhizobium sp. M0814 TaxID=2957004 RepID=UPI00333B3243
MRKLPPLSELRAFEAAARRLSFKDAAKELGVTPTAISHQILQLEAYCGLSLFRRQPRPLALTDAGGKLYSTVRQGLDSFSDVIAEICGDARQTALKLTATNAFAARWLVPRLPQWTRANPHSAIEISGTDDVIDLWNGDADAAIRYAQTPPSELIVHELFCDKFYPVCSPALLARGRPISRPADIMQHPLIHCIWPEWNKEAPTWQRWSRAARTHDNEMPEIGASGAINFREELHAIEAVVAGQGISILSDVVVGRELESGLLVKAIDISIPGMCFFLVHIPGHPRQSTITSLLSWIASV